jgi:hypothetical protein
MKGTVRPKMRRKKRREQSRSQTLYIMKQQGGQIIKASLDRRILKIKE